MGPHAHAPQGDPLSRPARAVGATCHVTSRRPCDGSNELMPRTMMAELVAAARGGRPGGVRRAGPAHLRRHLHPRVPADRRRGGRARRGAGGLPPGLPGPEALPRRRPVHHLALPDHRQLRVDPPGHAGPGTATTSSTTTSPVDDLRPEADPEAALELGGAPRPAAGRARGACRPGCGPWSCCATSTTCPTRPSPPSSGISESAAKVRLHRARRKLREDVFPARRRGDEEATPVRCDDGRRPARPTSPTGSVALDAPSAAPRRAVPALPGRAGAVPQAAAGAAGAAHRGARAGARAARRGPRRPRGGRRAPGHAHRCCSGRRVAYVGGLAAATAAGAAAPSCSPRRRAGVIRLAG